MREQLNSIRIQFVDSSGRVKGELSLIHEHQAGSYIHGLEFLDPYYQAIRDILPKARIDKNFPGGTIEELEILESLLLELREEVGPSDAVFEYLIGIGRRLPVIEHLMGFYGHPTRDVLHRLKAQAGKLLSLRLQSEQHERSYALALELAAKLWDEGDRMLDRQMARFLCKMDHFKQLDHVTLRKKLRGTAIEHSRLSGYAGGKLT